MWARTLVGGVVSGLVLMLANFVMHGLIMADTYRRYPDVFNQEDPGIGYFVLTCVLIGVLLAVLFTRTRGSWRRGLAGGALFGFLVGMIQFFTNFFDALVYEGFPYYLAWCHGGMDAIAFTLAGVVLGLVIKGA